MKLALVLALSAAAAAQVPAHSVSGGVTLDVKDVQIDVPYASMQTRALISACSSQEATTMWISVQYPDQTLASSEVRVEKHDARYCGSTIAASDSKGVVAVYVEERRQTTFPPPDPGAAAAAASTAAQRRLPVARRQPN